MLATAAGDTLIAEAKPRTDKLELTFVRHTLPLRVTFAKKARTVVDSSELVREVLERARGDINRPLGARFAGARPEFIRSRDMGSA